MYEELSLHMKEVIWLIAGALSDVTTASQSGPEKNDGYRVFRFPQKYRIPNGSSITSCNLASCSHCSGLKPQTVHWDLHQPYFRIYQAQAQISGKEMVSPRGSVVLHHQ